MVFTQIEFFIFFSVVLIGLAVLRDQSARKCLLLAASYYFYAYWDWRFLLLLIACTMANYIVALGLDWARGSPGKHKWLLIAGVTFNLGVLGFFKYFDFFCESLQGIVNSLGFHLGTLGIVLPVGISFYTFRMLSYIIDVYHGRIEPCRDVLDFALFVGFFPPLVAGPIARAGDFLPQLRHDIRPSWTGAFLGFRQFTIGLFKKVFIADRLGVYVDYAFTNAGLFDTSSTWLAVLAYGLQIYCDFSGYSDMAIGAARIMGYELPMNFNTPYLATSVTDFWRRWHITLSTWLRDYVYIPLGGNRRGERRMYVNLLITMVLGGLWHGASWTFVCWGAIHGGALVGDKWVRRKLERWPSLAVPKFLGWLVTMLVVFTAWVFFRASSFEQAFLMLRQMYIYSDGIHWHHPFTISILAAVGIVHILMAMDRLRPDQLLPDRIATPIVLFSMWWLVLVFSPKEFNPFVYSQF